MIRRLLIFIAFFLFLTFPTSVFAQDTGWVIESFDSNIIIHEDTHILVTETIDVDFLSLNKHGIYREIPIKYKTQYGNNLNIRFDLVEVADGVGNLLPNEVSYNGSDISIRIGDPERTITGKNTYIITYEVSSVVTQKNDNAELYWNVTGNGWPVPISNVTATITAPGVSRRTICFVGRFGEDGGDCESQEGQVSEFSAMQLDTGVGLTIASSYDPLLFTFPSFWERAMLFMTDNWVYFIPLIVFAFMTRIYWEKGRDKRYISIFHEGDAVQTVPLFERINALTTFHPPDDLSPGEVGVIVDEVVHSRDITSVIVDLAVRGFIKIKETTKGKIVTRSEFTLSLQGKDEKELKTFEKSILDMLFDTSREPSVKLSKLHKKSYKYLDEAKDNLYNDVTENGYFFKNPKSVRMTYLIVGVIVLFTSLMVGPIFAEQVGTISFLVSGAISGVIVILFSFFMPARTAKGRKALAEIVGLREYVKVGAWRQKEYEKKNFFEETLPYTIAFGLTAKFIKAFKGANIPKPDWYQSTNTFNAVRFASSMNSFDFSLTRGISATRPKSASSGGSGFSGGSSGGGFGGGGGGSW